MVTIRQQSETHSPKMKTLQLFVSVAAYAFHCLSDAANASNIVKGELEEDVQFWSRTLTMSMSMAMNLGGESYVSGGSCGSYCESDNDCQRGGYNTCPLCGQYVGTQYYKRCYEPDYYTPSPTPYNYFPDAGMCRMRCKEDDDCRKGGYNPCARCGKYMGTIMYELCYSDPDYYLTPSPTPYNYFPEGGMCGMRCKKDSDCRKGGYNPCAWCGKYMGTIMYELCYSDPDYDD